MGSSLSLWCETWNLSLKDFVYSVILLTFRLRKKYCVWNNIWHQERILGTNTSLVKALKQLKWKGIVCIIQLEYFLKLIIENQHWIINQIFLIQRSYFDEFSKFISGSLFSAKFKIYRYFLWIFFVSINFNLEILVDLWWEWNRAQSLLESWWV